MRVISFNANGIRSAAKKGFFDWFAQQEADFLCVQELKAQKDKLNDQLFFPAGYHRYSSHAQKNGYSGVAIYSRYKPLKKIEILGFECCDTEGRYVQLDFKNLSVASLYLPSGSSGDERQAVKMKFLKHYEPILAQQLKTSHPLIICGDWNIAHQKCDLKNWVLNQKTSGFLPEERAWMDHIFNLGFVDAFRVLNQNEGEYTWWSMRSKQARSKNIGWRIDYQIISPILKNKIQAVSIYKDENFSDHAPLVIDYALEVQGV